MLDTIAHPSRVRLLYEVAALSFLMEKAGGKTTDGAKSCLEQVVEGYDQKSTVIMGSKDEVDLILKFLEDNKEDE